MNGRKKLCALLASAALLVGAAFACSGLAHADGQASSRATYDRPYDWGGFYFGIHSGYQWSQFSASFPDGNPALTVVGVAGQGFDVDHSAEVVGGQIGIQHQFGMLVVGIEGTLTTAFRNNFGASLCPKQTIALFDCVARFDDVITIGGRLGLAKVTDCCKAFMPYITAGYATMEWSAEGRNRSLAPGATTIVQWGDGRNTGWYIGGGVEWAMAQGWTVGLDYRHYEFDTNRELARAIVGGVWGPLPNDTAAFDMSVDTVTLRVSWKFGRDYAAPLK